MLIESVPRDEREFLNKFGVDSLDVLFQALPEFAVVILDQFDSTDNLSKDIPNLIRQIGIRSRNSKRGTFIVCVSNIEVGDIMVNLNGREKIRQYGKVSDFRWSEVIVQDFVENWCENRDEAEKNAILELGNIAQSPGFLYEIYKEEPNTIEISDLKEKALEKQKIWKEFEEHKF